MLTNRKLLLWVIAGDIVCAALVSLVGFYTHYGEIQGWRWLSSFIPVVAAWILIAPWIKSYHSNVLHYPIQAWHAGLAAFLSAPLAAWLRGIWLNSAIQPLFVGVLGITNAFGFVLWRVLLAFVLRRFARNG